MNIRLTNSSGFSAPPMYMGTIFSKMPLLEENEKCQLRNDSRKTQRYQPKGRGSERNKRKEKGNGAKRPKAVGNMLQTFIRAITVLITLVRLKSIP